MSKFVKQIAAQLQTQYHIRDLPGTIIDGIEKYTTINTPEGQKWMVEYKRQWHLLELDRAIVCSTLGDRYPTGSVLICLNCLST